VLPLSALSFCELGAAGRDGAGSEGPRYNVPMRIARGKVVGNTVVLEDPSSGEPMHEGQSVTVYIDEDGWTLDEASTQELLEAMAECDRGEFVSAEEVFASLPTRH
jgi:hypothetical protein